MARLSQEEIQARKAQRQRDDLWQMLKRLALMALFAAATKKSKERGRRQALSLDTPLVGTFNKRMSINRKVLL